MTGLKEDEERGEGDQPAFKGRRWKNSIFPWP